MLILVRHGRTKANASGLLQGRVDHDLDALGRLQAAAIATSVGHLDRIISSPLGRARQTAEAVAALRGDVPFEIDERWIELDYGDWEEVPVRDVAADTWAAWRADSAFTPPGGESLEGLQARVEEACAALALVAATEDVAVFTHVSPIKAAIAWALGVGPSISWRMNVGQASISRIRLDGRGPSLISFNEVTHLVGVDEVV
jgi:broad specificity phosphatase PhoE